MCVRVRVTGSEASSTERIRFIPRHGSRFVLQPTKALLVHPDRVWVHSPILLDSTSRVLLILLFLIYTTKMEFMMKNGIEFTLENKITTCNTSPLDGESFCSGAPDRDFEMLHIQLQESRSGHDPEKGKDYPRQTKASLDLKPEQYLMWKVQLAHHYALKHKLNQCKQTSGNV